jgi:four helix bundle protein
MIRNFRNIKAWQLADEMVFSIYKKTNFFPKEELYGLTSQVRRAAVSVCANIAEGAARLYKKEYLKFLNINNGSMAEVEYLLYLSNKIGYLNDNDYADLERQRKSAAMTLSGLIKAVKKEAGEN